MPRDIVRMPPGSSASPYYSAATIAGGFVFVSGQGPWDPERGEFSSGPIEEQAELTLRRLEAVLAQAGAGLQDVVKVGVHLADIDDFELFNQVYIAHFPHAPPARTTVGSNVGGILVEIDAIAFTGR
jgi:2-iminobutanoate/2-iminopropanoate deaminase